MFINDITCIRRTSPGFLFYSPGNPCVGRFPRFLREAAFLVKTRGTTLLASELIERRPLAHDLTDSHFEAVAIGNRIVPCSAIVKTELLFIQIPEQVKRFHAHIGSVNHTLCETPEILF